MFYRMNLSIFLCMLKKLSAVQFSYSCMYAHVCMGAMHVKTRGGCLDTFSNLSSPLFFEVGYLTEHEGRLAG